MNEASTGDIATAGTLRQRRVRDVIAILRAQHRRIRAQFRQFERCQTSEARARIAERVCQLLVVQMMTEEQVFFPAFVDATGDLQACCQAEVEHDAMKRLIVLINDSVPEGELFAARMRVLGAMHENHVQQKEKRDGMFAEASSAGMDLEALGARLRSRGGLLKSRLELLRWRVPETRAAHG